MASTASWDGLHKSHWQKYSVEEEELIDIKNILDRYCSFCGSAQAIKDIRKEFFLKCGVLTFVPLKIVPDEQQPGLLSI